MIEYYRFYEVETLINQGKLQEAVAELRALQKLYLELSQDNSKLKVQLHDLEEILSISQNIIFDGDAYWLISGGEKQGPFCPKCYHANGDLIRMSIQKKDEFTPQTLWICPHCNFVAEPDVDLEPAKAAAPRAKVIPFVQ